MAVPTFDERVIPLRLRAARLAAGLAANAVARDLGVHPNTMVNWESGRSQPTLTQFAQLSIMYGRSADWLLARDTQTHFLALVDRTIESKILDERASYVEVRARVTRASCFVTESVDVVTDMDVYVDRMRALSERLKELGDREAKRGSSHDP